MTDRRCGADQPEHLPQANQPWNYFRSTIFQSISSRYWNVTDR